MAWAVTAAFPANAQTATYGGTPDQITMTIPVTAFVDGRCAFSTPPQTEIDVGDITGGFSRDVPLRPVCNTPFRVAVLSQNGGLRAPVQPPAGYSGLAPYTVSLTLYSDVDASAVRASCDTRQLAVDASGPCAFRGPADGSSGLRAGRATSLASGSFLRVSAPADNPAATLIASQNYRDTLTVSISASP